MSAHPSTGLHPSGYETLECTIDGAIATVSLNRPRQANAMNEAMWDELESCFRALDAAEAVRVVILRGNGKHFCAGIDLDMLTGMSPEGEPARAAERLRDRILELQRNLSTIEACRKPVLAEVHGACLGGGLDIISCCDLRYCTDDARFAIKEIDVGLVADVGSLQRLPYLIGEGCLRELALTGRELRGAEAHSIGLANASLADQNSLREHVRQIAAQIASKSPLAVRGTKQVLNYGRNHGPAVALDYVATWNSAMLSMTDVREAIAATTAQRAAIFDD
ncbi:MAG: crotonase/enoyl-CoA hydratase family protein [Pseudomonadota bacterium]